MTLSPATNDRSATHRLPPAAHVPRASIATSGVSALLLSLGAPALAQQDFDAVEIVATDLGGGIHLLVGEGATSACRSARTGCSSSTISSRP